MPELTSMMEQMVDLDSGSVRIEIASPDAGFHGAVITRQFIVILVVRSVREPSHDHADPSMLLPRSLATISDSMSDKEAWLSVNSF